MTVTSSATTSETQSLPPSAQLRQRWLKALARADRPTLEAALAGEADIPGWRPLRATETGLAMVRGRMGGSGAPFNLGEMTMSRAAIVTEGGTAGFGWVQGRDSKHAELVAVFDALLQDEDRQARLIATVVAPIEDRLAEQAGKRAAEVAASRVEFFTLVRGD